MNVQVCTCVGHGPGLSVQREYDGLTAVVPGIPTSAYFSSALSSTHTQKERGHSITLLSPQRQTQCSRNIEYRARISFRSSGL